MAKASNKGITKKRPGRPKTGRDPVITLRFPPELTEQIDAWAKARKMTRSAAIRRWVQNGVDSDRWKPR